MIYAKVRIFAQLRCLHFYFVSYSSEVIDLLFFFFTPIFSNLHILVFLTIFLHSMYDLHLKYDMMIFFSGNLSGFWIFSGFFRIFLKFSDLTISLVIMDSLLLKFTMMTLFSKFFRIFFKSSVLTILIIFFQNIYDISLKYDVIIFFFY